MAEYIKREATIKAIVDSRNRYYNSASNQYLVGRCDGLDIAAGLLRVAPAADVAPVVRCANCKHRMLDVIYGLVCNHSYGLRKIFHDSYCPYGEYQTNAGGGADG